jgi:hypothetical protein
MLNRRRLVATVLGATLLLGVAVTPAAALTQISLTGCAVGGGVQQITPDFVYLKAGWGAKTKGQLLSNLKSLTWNVTVDGTAVDVTPFIADPYKDSDNWWVYFYLPAGQLALDETMTASVESFLSKPVYDGYDHYPAGSFGTFECTIVADLT